MSQSAIIIHKGGKEEKYEIYVEDYVLSFLKAETGTLELSEFYFYGFKENYGRKYTIYGVGRDRHLPVFAQYSLLEEIGCRLTQAGPVFLVREGADHYEVKGYDVFYQDNTQMQAYLIERKQFHEEKRKDHSPVWTGKNRVISIQLGMILMLLVAIVINSANSYDKMRQLNQSATEIFFAMENQDAERTAQTGASGEVVATRDPTQEEDTLKLKALADTPETEAEESGDDEAESGDDEAESGAAQESDAGAAQTEGPSHDEAGGESDAPQTQEDGEEAGQPAEEAVDQEEDPEELEALSRNVARYYQVERGDTLYTISQKIYGDTAHVQKICELNQITDPDRIRDGQKIILP